MDTNNIFITPNLLHLSEFALAAGQLQSEVCMTVATVKEEKGAGGYAHGRE